jgi:hypothetical protein
VYATVSEPVEWSNRSVGVTEGLRFQDIGDT